MQGYCFDDRRVDKGSHQKERLECIDARLFTHSGLREIQKNSMQ